MGWELLPDRGWSKMAWRGGGKVLKTAVSVNLQDESNGLGLERIGLVLGELTWSTTGVFTALIKKSKLNLAVKANVSF